MEPFQLASISLSGLSLAHGLVTSLAEMLPSSKLKTAQGKALGFVFFALDVWARCTALALGLVPSVRLAACGIIAGYWLLSLVAYLKNRGWRGCEDFLGEFVLEQLFFVYIVPAAAITEDPRGLQGLLAALPGERGPVRCPGSGPGDLSAAAGAGGVGLPGAGGRQRGPMARAAALGRERPIQRTAEPAWHADGQKRAA